MTFGAAARGAFGLAWQASPGRVVARAGIAVALGLVPGATVALTRAVLNGVAEQHSVLVPAVGLAACGAVAAVSSPVTSYLVGEHDRRIARLAATRLYGAVARQQGLARLEEPAFHDRLRLAESGAAQAPGATVTALVNAATATLAAAGMLLVLAHISALMAVIVLGAAVPAVAAELAMSRRRTRMLFAVAPAERRELFYRQLLVDLRAAKEIRLFGLAGFFADRMRQERLRSDREHRAVDRRELGTQTLLTVLGGLVSGAGLVWAATRAGRTPGDVAAFVTAVVGLQTASGTLVGLVAGLHRDLAIFAHFQAVEATPPDLVDAVDAPALAPLRRGIVLRDVWFRYGPDQPWVLRGIDLTIPAGAAVGLVGRNGAGKSTLVKLIGRLYDPTRGTIEWDGRDLRDIPICELRSHIGAVFQDFVPYDLTAVENVGLGDLSRLKDRAAVTEAAMRAGVHEVIIGLPNGYDTQLSRIHLDAEDGAEQVGHYLSGGQWQKLATARAFMRADRDLLILDEPTSGLDAEAEYDLAVRLRGLRAGRTSLLVSHRLGSLRDADLIVTLDGGRIAEAGDHDTLLRRQGLYASLFHRQASGYEPVLT